MLLDTFSEQYIRVFSKDDGSIDTIMNCFLIYCEENNLIPVKVVQYIVFIYRYIIYTANTSVQV